MAVKQKNGVYAPDGSLYITLTDGAGNLVTAGGSSSGITIGTTTITSGTDTRVLFDDGGKVGEDAGFTYIKATDALTVIGQVSGANFALGGSATNGVYSTGGHATFGDGPTNWMIANSGNIYISSTSGLGFNSTTSPGSGGADVTLFRDAANTLAQRNGANAQTFNIYNTYTDASNNERGYLAWGGNTLFLNTSFTGTGVSRAMDIGTVGASAITLKTANTPRWTIGATGSLINTSYTLGDQAQVFSVTATQPASPTGQQNAITATITSAGSASQINGALNLTYAAGYTGSSTTFGVLLNNFALGTANTLIPAAGSDSVLGNIGIAAGSGGTVSALNIGGRFAANGGNVNVAVIGTAQTVKNSATNIGVAGTAINTGTSPVMVGGFFSLNQTTVPTVSAALIADNGAQAQPIFLARDNGSTVFTIADGGVATFTNQLITQNSIGLAASTSVFWTGQGSISGNANGFVLTDNAGTSFSRLMFGGTTSSFPAFKRSTTTLQARLADDSAFCPIQGKLTTDTAYTAGTLVPTGYITLYDSTGTAYRVPCII